MSLANILIVPGLRDHVEDHWQTHLARELAAHYQVFTVEPLVEDKLSCAARVQAIQSTVESIAGPFIAIAHSGGVIMLAHWARQYQADIRSALLVTPPDFETPLPAGYPTLETLQAHGWLPVPAEHLPFPTVVAGSANDPLATEDKARQMARQWGSRWISLGAVGHLNPASGYGPWPMAAQLTAQLEKGAAGFSLP